MKNFWQELPKPFFILAPMEAVTDVVFRHVVTKAAQPDVYFTEFTNAASYFSEKGRPSTRGRLAFTQDEQPMVAQIWGSVPEHFGFMAKGLAEQGFAGIDINMGCPAKDVVKTGGGSGLIATPERAAEIIAAAKESGLPVSVKTRLGISSTAEWRDWLTHVLKQDIVNLTIHLRTRKEMSKVDAHYEMIQEIVALRNEIAPQTLLSINGDIRNRAHGLELVAANPGVDGVMIGRGIFTDPYAFADETLANEVATEAPEAHQQRLLGLLEAHLDLFDKHAKELEPRPFDPLKRFFKIYVRDFPGAGELRDKLMHTKSTDEVRELLRQA